MKIKVELEVELEDSMSPRDQGQKDLFSDHILVADGLLALYSAKIGTVGIVSIVHKIEFEVKD